MADDTEESMRRLKEAMEVLTGAYADETAAMRAKRQADEEAVAKKKKNDDALAAAGATARAALGSFGKSLLSTEAGMAKYNAGLSSAGTAAFDIGKNFGILGMAVGGLVKLFTMGMELVNKQNDAMIKAYDTLSEFGQTAKFTTMDILALGRASGFTSHNLEIFTKNASAVSQELAGLTGSASDGLKAFGKLTSVTQEQRNQYNRLGISQERLLEMQGLSIKQSVSGGIALTKNADEQRKASLAYIDAQLELAALTGIDVKKQQQLQDAVNADLNFQQYKYNEDRKAQSIRAEAEKQDSSEEGKQRRAKLLADAASIQEDISKRNQLAILAKEKFGDERATGMLQSLATKNMNVVTEQTAGMAAAGWNNQKILNELNSGRSGMAAMMGENRKAVAWFSKTMGDVAAMTGKAGQAMQGAFSQSSKDIHAATEFTQFDTEEKQKAWEDSRILIKEELEKKRLGLGLYDQTKEAQNAQLTVELQARQAMDELTKTISGPLTNAFTGIMKAMSYLAKGMAKVAGWALGNDEIEKLFETKEDVQEKLDKNKEDVAAGQSQINQQREIVSGDNEKIEQVDLAKSALEAAKIKSTNADKKFLEFKDPNDKIDRVREKETAAVELKYAEEVYAARKNAAVFAISNANKLKELEEKQARKIKEQEILKKSYADKGGILEKDARELSIEERVNKNQEIIDQKKLIALKEEDNKYTRIREFAKEGISEAEYDKLSDEKKKIILKRLALAQEVDKNKLDELKKRLSELQIEATQRAIAEFDKEKQSDNRSPATPSAPLPKGDKGLLEQIARGEGTSDEQAQQHGIKSGYDVSLAYGKYGGKTDKPLSEMTFGEVKEYQKKMLDDQKVQGIDATKRSSAVGKFQFITETLKAQQIAAGYKDTDKFDAQAQEKMAMQLLTTAGLDKFKSGKMSGSALQKNIAGTWASVADPTSGKSQYGQATGTSTEQIKTAMEGARTPEEPSVAQAAPQPSVAQAAPQPSVAQAAPQPSVAQSTLPNPVTDPKGYKAAVNARALRPTEAETPSAAFGGVLSGPTSGYPVTLHGREAVVPMPNPNSLIAEGDSTKVQKDPLPTTTSAAPAATNADNKVLLELFQMLSDKMDTLGDYMASGNDTREELLKYSRV